MIEKVRLDVAMLERGFVDSREKGKALIMAGLVYVNGQKETKAGSRQATCFFVCNYREMGMYYYIWNIGRCDCQHLVFTDRYFTGMRYSTIFMDDNVILFYDKTQIFLFCLCRWSFGTGANNCQWVWNNAVSF